MLSNALKGLLAGTAGTVALNIATYADMALRGRSSSTAPAKMVETLADKAHISLASEGKDNQDQTAQNRESGAGALFGFFNGLGTGVAYSMLRSQGTGIPLPFASLLVGLAAMAESDVPLALLKVSNPRTWGTTEWLADLIPHLIYGFVTVATYEALSDA